MSINVSEVIWTIICFFALFFVLKTFLFGPLIRFMDERRRRLDDGAETARQTQTALDDARRGAEESRHAYSEQARELIAEGRLEDEKYRAEALDEAHHRSTHELHEAGERAAQEEKTMREEAERQKEELARLLADRMLRGAGADGDTAAV